MRSRYAEEILEAVRDVLAEKLADIAQRTDVTEQEATVLNDLAKKLSALLIFSEGE